MKLNIKLLLNILHNYFNYTFVLNAKKITSKIFKLNYSKCFLKLFIL